MILSKTNRSRRLPLLQLEEMVNESYHSGPKGPISAPEWLDYFQRCSKTRLFDLEPDFEPTLAEFARMLENIPASRHVPKPDFEPDKAERERARLWEIRNTIYELHPIQRELSAMCRRAFRKLEGVSKIEFEIRKAWFHANIDDLPMHFMIPEDGTTEPCNNTVETALSQGTASRYALNAILILREWEKGNYDKTKTYGEWQRRRQLSE